MTPNAVLPLCGANSPSARITRRRRSVGRIGRVYGFDPRWEATARDARDAETVRSIDQSQSMSHCRRFRPTTNAELAEDVRHVRASRAFRDEELFGDLTIASPVCDQSEDLALATREARRVERRRLDGGRHVAGEVETRPGREDVDLVQERPSAEFEGDRAGVPKQCGGCRRASAPGSKGRT